MANLIRIKRSAVPGKVPLTTDLQLGELALNTYDGKLYTKKDDGTASIVDLTDGINYTVSTTAPPDPLTGAKWFNTDLGIEFTYIDDGNSAQWVDTSSGAVFNGAGAPASQDDAIAYAIALG